MKSISYSVIQYRHDRASGEAVNVGVLAFDAEEGKVALEFDHSHKRLADLYHSFDAKGYRLAFGKFLAGLEMLGLSEGDALFLIQDSQLRSSDDIARRVWPDQGLSLMVSAPRFVASVGVELEAKALYRRYVANLRHPEKSHKRRDDEALWNDILRRSSRFEGVAARLKPEKVGPQEVEFNHVAHLSHQSVVAIEPVSLDYVDGSHILERAYNLGGKAFNLHDFAPFERLYVVLGAPSRAAQVGRASERAKEVLAKFPKVSVFDEDEAEDVLSEFDGKME